MLTRAAKEIRPLLMPSALVLGTAVAAAALEGRGPAFDGLALWLWPAAFFFGITLAAALPFGSEFQQRTVVLLLSQPITRRRLWLEKWLALAVVMFIVTTITALVAPLKVPQVHPASLTTLYVVLMVCSAGFWTLLAGSTLGGAVFSVAVPLTLAVSLGSAAEALWGTGTMDRVAARPSTLPAAVAAYSAVTAWLSWYVFSRLQVTHAGEHAAAGATDLGASRTVAWLRTHPARVWRNLFVNELHLHRPTFLVAAVFTIVWLAVLGVSLLQPSRAALFETTMNVVAACYLGLVFLLAGCVSIGEESSLGVRASQLTLPISARALWVIKAGSALVVAALLGLALPLLLATLAGEDQTRTLEMVLSRPMGVAAALSALVTGFWAATMIGHTVRSAVAAVAMIVALGVCAAAGLWLAQLVVSADARGLTTRALGVVMTRLQLSPDTFYVPGLLRAATWVLFAGVIVAAMRQSLTAFKRVQSRPRQIAASISGLLGAVFVSMFAVAGVSFTSMTMYRSAPVLELESALRAVTVTEQAQVRGTRRITEQELLDRVNLSPATRTWIAGADIRVERSRNASPWCVATVTFPNRRTYRFMFKS